MSSRPGLRQAQGLRPGAGFVNNRIVPSRDNAREDRSAVPTLFKFVAFLAIVAGLVFGGMVALVAFVKPEPREIVEIVPPAKLQPK